MLCRPLIESKLDEIQAFVEDKGLTMHSEFSSGDRLLTRAGEDLDVLLAELAVLHELADYFRRTGLCPMPRVGPDGQAWESWQFRWLHHDRLSGPPTRRRLFTLAGLDGDAEPGCWTASEVRAANPPAAAAS